MTTRFYRFYCTGVFIALLCFIGCRNAEVTDSEHPNSTILPYEPTPDPKEKEPYPGTEGKVLQPGEGHERREATESARQKALDERKDERVQMIETQMIQRGIKDERVLNAMKSVPRHRFVPKDYQNQAYEDHPIQIGHQQTISQPYIVALMTELVRPKENEKALDVGTGSGYQAAILSELVSEVYSIEILEPLAKSAKNRLENLGYDNVTVRHGDGYDGWPDEAPFDVIILAAAPQKVPQPLIDQLAPGGRLVLPVGDSAGQELILIEKDETGESVSRRTITAVAFVPMTGKTEEVDK